MIRVTGTIPASEGMPEDLRPLDAIPTEDGEDFTVRPSSRLGPKDAESFDLSYTEEEGWSNPDARILMKINRKMRGITKIRLLPYRGGYNAIQPTLEGTEQEVASTVATIGSQLSPPIEQLNVVSDVPRVDEPNTIH